MKKESKHHIIRYSKLTGKAVWINRNSSKIAVRKAYYRACKREITRVANWGKTVARRRENIQRLLSLLTEGLSIFEQPSERKETAIRQILSVIKEDYICDYSFYNHIMSS